MVLLYVKIQSAEVGKDLVKVAWSDGHQSLFHHVHLRAWCTCSQCKHSTGQRLVNVSDVPINPIIDKLSCKLLSYLYLYLKLHSLILLGYILVQQDGLHIKWQDSNTNGHDSFFSPSELRDLCYSKETLDKISEQSQPKFLKPTDKIPTIQYDEVVKGNEGLLQLLTAIAENGFAVVNNVPCEKGQVKKFAEIIAPVSHS